MSNQFILWSTIIIPWFTLLFMKREEIKRYMPVAFFTLITNSLFFEVSRTLNLLVVRETVFPLSYSFPFIYGAFPVVTIWIFKFTYERFWLYVITNLVLNLGFNFLIMPWVVSRGIVGLINFTYLQGFIVTMVHAFLLYGYQLWQENALVPSVKKIFSPRLQSAATKPFFEDEDNKDSR